MKMLILPEMEAVHMADNIDNKTSIISITCPSERDVDFSDNKNICSIFRMKFNDIERDYDLPSGPLLAPIQSDFDGLKNFVDSLDCETLIVHCAAGYSRSAAVGAAINEYLGLGLKIFGNPNYYPNSVVYKCCMQEFGIHKDQKFYEEIFKEHEFAVTQTDTPAL